MPTPPPSLAMPPRPRGVTFGSSLGGDPNASSVHPVRAATPGPRRPEVQGDGCLLHVTNFPTPLSHQEMVKYCVDTLALPSTTKVVTRGFFAQRVSLRFEDETSAREYHDGFRAREHKIYGTKHFIQKDLAPQQRKMGYMLRAARRILAKNGVALDKLHISARDGILYHNRYPILSVYHESPRFLKHWPHAQVSNDIVMGEITGCGLPCPTCAWLQLCLPRVTTWNSSALFSADVQLRRSRIKVLKGLLRHPDVVAVQETHLNQSLQLPRGDFRDFHVYTSVHAAGRNIGGLLVLIRRSWVETGCIVPLELWPGIVMAFQITWPHRQPFTRLACHITAELRASWRDIATVTSTMQVPPGRIFTRLLHMTIGAILRLGGIIGRSPCLGTVALTTNHAWAPVPTSIPSGDLCCWPDCRLFPWLTLGSAVGYYSKVPWLTRWRKSLVSL
eukprot:3024512-Amphidinium_carterae.1